MGCKECQIKKIKVEGEIFECDFLIVGESPGATEEAVGRPFVGDSGKLLNQMIHTYLKRNREEIAITNACKCRIPEDIKRVKSLLKNVIKPCREYLVQDIKKVKPKLIIVLGEIALSQVFGKWMSIGSNRGRILENKEFNCYVYPVYHPSAILRMGGVSNKNPRWIVWQKDWEYIGDFIRNGFPKKTFEYSRFTSASDFNSIALGLDAEWNDKEELLVFSFSDGKKARYLTLQDLDRKTAERFYQLIYRKIIALANRPVDERILKKHGIELRKCYKVDIFNMANLVNENIKINLENIAEIYTDEKNIKESSKKVGKKVWLMERKELIEYNCRDSLATAKAFKTLYKKLKKDEKLFRYWKKFILPVEDMLANVCMEGFKIDREKLEHNKAFMESELTRLEMELISEVHPKIIERHKDLGLKLSRPDFLIDILFASRYGFRLKAKEFTPTGKPSLESTHLNQFKEHPWVEKLLLYKKLYKFYTTYLKGLEKNIKPDGKIYPSVVLYATRTGRTACYNPNIQQVPRSGPYVEKIKELYEAPEGWMLCARDLAQSEIRIVAWHANEKVILNALKKGIDIHRLTASKILNKKIDEVTKNERQMAKPINFSMIYGGSAKMLQEYAYNEYGVKMTLEEAEKFREKYFQAYPNLPIYHRRCIEIAHKYGYVRSVLGRIRRLPHINSNDPALVSQAERQAINFPIQSFSSDLGLIGMYLFWREVKNKKSVRVLWFIHDAVFFMCRQDLVPKYMALLKECMEERAIEYIERNFKIKVGYPVESDGKFGKNWAVMQDYED